MFWRALVRGASVRAPLFAGLAAGVALGCTPRAEQAEPPLLAAGVVRDSLGRPVVGTALGVMHLPPGRTQWAYWGWGDSTDDAGRFEVRVEPPPGPAKLHVLAAPTEHWRAREPVRPGTREVEIVWDAHGTVAGSILLDPELPADAVDVEFVSDHGARVSSLHQRRNGRFELEVETPCTGRLRVFESRSERTLVELDGIAVRPGERADDPRLRLIDLRGALDFVLLEVVDESGGDVLPARVFVLTSEGYDVLGRIRIRSEGSRGWTTFGHLACVVEGPVDVVVTAPGFAVATRRGVLGRERVELEPVRETDVFVSLPPDPGPGVDDLFFQLEWVLPWDAARSVRLEGRPAAALALVLPLAPGRYRTTWRRFSDVEREAVPGAEVLEVPPGAERIELRVTPPPPEGR